MTIYEDEEQVSKIEKIERVRFSSYYKNLINQTYNNKVEQQCFEGGEWHRILLAQCYKVSAVFFFFFLHQLHTL